MQLKGSLGVETQNPLINLCLRFLAFHLTVIKLRKEILKVIPDKEASNSKKSDGRSGEDFSAPSQGACGSQECLLKGLYADRP